MHHQVCTVHSCHINLINCSLHIGQYCQELDSSWVLGVSIVKGSCEGKGFQWCTGQRFRWERKAQTGQKMRGVYDCQEVDKYKTGGKVQLLCDTYTWYCTAYGKQSPNKDVIENGPEAHRRYYVTLRHTRMVCSRRHHGSMWVIVERSGSSHGPAMAYMSHGRADAESLLEFMDSRRQPTSEILVIFLGQPTSAEVGDASPTFLWIAKVGEN